MPRDITSDELTGEERLKIERLLQIDVDYVDSLHFHPARLAEKTLFSKPEDVPAAEVGWYLSYLNARDNVATCNQTKTHRNVLLTKQQETLLFLRFNFAKFKLANMIRLINKKGFTLRRCRDLLKWHRVSLELRQQLAEMNLAMVLGIVHKYNHSNAHNDMVSIGNTSLMRAIEKFDTDKGNKFSTYAWRAVQRAVFRERQVNALHQHTFPVQFDPTKELEYQTKSKDVEQCKRHDNIEAIRYIIDNNLAKLDLREQEIIRLRFFAERPDGTRFGLQEIGHKFGVSRTCIQLVERKALLKIQDAWLKHVG